MLGTVLIPKDTLYLTISVCLSVFWEWKHFLEVQLVCECSKLLKISSWSLNCWFLVLSSFVCPGLTNKSLDDQRTQPEIPGLKLANPAVLPAPQKADADAELSPQVLWEEMSFIKLPKSLWKLQIVLGSTVVEEKGIITCNKSLLWVDSSPLRKGFGIVFLGFTFFI